jgi:hypothetical protein
MTVLLSGCVVQSFHPFHTGKNLVFPKELLGSWKVQKFAGNAEEVDKINLWDISGTSATDAKLQVFDKQNAVGMFHIRFFKVGETLFLDVEPAEPSDEAKFNGLWLFTLRPTHTVCKVETKGNILMLKPISFDWLKKSIEAKKVSLPFLGDLKEIPLFTATPAEWQTFLGQHAGDAEAFPETSAYVLLHISP